VRSCKASRTTYFVCTVLALSFVSPNSANAEEDKYSAEALKLPDQAYVSGWFIEPGPLTLPTEPLKGGETILKTVLFPYKSYAIDNKFEIDGAKDQLEVGTELIGFIAHRPTACTEKAVSRTAGQALLLRGGTRHLCLIDSDSDGKFDKKFFVDNGGSLFAHQALVPNDVIAIEPIAYHETDRKSSSVSGYLHLFYYSHHSLVKEFSIGFSFLRNDGSDPMTNGVTAYSFKDKEIPLSTKIFGGSYRVEQMIKGRILLRSEEPQSLTPIYLGTQCCR
jgi:hypothetical protein